MKLNGLLIDEKAIGAGIYGLICEAGKEGIVSVGMIPIEFVEMLRKTLRAKLVSINAEALGCKPADLEGARIGGKPVIDEGKVAELVAEIEKKVVSEIYAAAARAGKMLV